MRFYNRLIILFSISSFSIFLLLDASNQENIACIQRMVDERSTIILNDLPDDSNRFVPEKMPVRLLPIPHNLPITGAQILSTYTVIKSEPTRVSFPSPLPTLLFEGLRDSLTVIPPDTQGAVGINHIMTTLNDRVRIQTKTGIELRTVTLGGFWGLSSGSIPFDPKIVYDPYANRWIFTTLINPDQPSSMIFLAVSQTSDPLGAWNIYRIKADPAATATSGIWADFPSLGFNNKWIVLQANMFNIGSESFNRSQVYVFSKAELYANGPGNYRLFTLDGLGATQTPAITYDNVHPTLYLLQNWNGDASGAGYILLYALNGSLGSEILSIVGFVSVTRTWASFPPFINGGFAPQLGTSIRIDNNDSRMLSVLFRNGSIWAAHTAFLPASSPTHSAIQWWQITPTGIVQQFGRIEDTLATLNTGNFFAFPSIAVNASNNVLIGYSFFNSLIYASSGYSYRAASDIANTMRGTSIIRNGLDVYTKDFGSGEVRWGDYSSTVVDPNDTDFWTLQESADLRTLNGTSRWTTWWARVS